MHHSSQRDNCFFVYFQLLVIWQGVVFYRRTVVVLTTIVVVVAPKNSPQDCFLNVATVLKEIITYLTEYSKTPKPSRFSGFCLCLVFCFGANLVQIILKCYDTRNVIVLLLYPISSKYVTAQTTQSKY